MHVQSVAKTNLLSGISSAYGGPLSALDIQYSLTPMADDTSKVVEKETLTALYDQSKQVLLRKERTIDFPTDK